jgi:hypothetical protein
MEFIIGVFVLCVLFPFFKLTMLFIETTFPHWCKDRIVKTTAASGEERFVLETYFFHPINTISEHKCPSMEDAQKYMRWNNNRRIVKREVIA